MIGISRISGKSLSGIDHIKQSITDILTTPIGTRVMRRHYGSYLPELIDKPINKSITQKVRAATVLAIQRWEPRIKLKQVMLSISAKNIEVSLFFERNDLPKQEGHINIVLPTNR